MWQKSNLYSNLYDYRYTHNTKYYLAIFTQNIILIASTVFELWDCIEENVFFFFCNNSIPNTKTSIYIDWKKGQSFCTWRYFLSPWNIFFVSFLLAILWQTVAKGNCLTCLSDKYRLIHYRFFLILHVRNNSPIFIYKLIKFGWALSFQVYNLCIA